MHCWWWPALHFWLLCIQICHCWCCVPPRFHLQFILHMFLFLFQLEMVSVPKGLLDWFILEFVRFKPIKRTIATLAIRQKSGQQICLMKLKMSTRVYENWAPTSLGAQIRFRVLMKLGYLHLNCHWHSFRCISSLFPQKGDFCDINHAERGSGRVWMCRPQTDHT